MKVSDLNSSVTNPRTVTKEKLKALKDSMMEFGDLSGIIYNRVTDTLLGGHQRITTLPKNAEVEIAERYDEPTSVGTVALGWVSLGDERFSYREVEWDEKKHELAMIRANVQAGEWDYQQLSETIDYLSQFDDVDLGWTGFDTTQLDEIIAGEGWDIDTADNQSKYTSKIESPIYEPKDETPPAESDLYDTATTQALVTEILDTDMPEDVQRFLLAAAARHTVFRYDKIAEYYAHASKTVQQLMENSALVIIDYDKAIELGFVKLNKKIDQAWLEQVENESDA